MSTPVSDEHNQPLQDVSDLNTKRDGRKNKTEIGSGFGRNASGGGGGEVEAIGYVNLEEEERPKLGMGNPIHNESVYLD